MNDTQLFQALEDLFQACEDLPLKEMNRMEKEINAASLALRASNKDKDKMGKPCEEDLLIEGTGWFCRLPDGHRGLHVAIGRDEKGREYAITWSSEIKDVLSEEYMYESLDA